MVLMENDAFLTELTKLFERTRERGTVTCVMKIVKEGQNKPTPKGEKRPEPTLEEVRDEMIDAIFAPLPPDRQWTPLPRLADA